MFIVLYRNNLYIKHLRKLCFIDHCFTIRCFKIEFKPKLNFVCFSCVSAW